MNFKEFKRYKSQFVTAIRQAVTEGEPRMFNGAAFPAYLHTNPIINFLFWERIRKVINFLERAPHYTLAMDFGCGSGVMLPFLGRVCDKVVAIDIDLFPLEEVEAHVRFPDNVEFRDAHQIQIRDFPATSFDVIVALNVLEHVENLVQTLADLLVLLRPKGKLIICGPTENLTYKIGRVLAGPEYSGNYHRRSVYDVKEVLASLTTIEKIATLYYPIPLYEIFYGTA